MDIIRETGQKYLVKRAAVALLGGLLDYQNQSLQFLDLEDLETIYKEVVLEDLKLSERYLEGVVDRSNGPLRAAL